jgi:hypothetical protein
VLIKTKSDEQVNQETEQDKPASRLNPPKKRKRKKENRQQTTPLPLPGKGRAFFSLVLLVLHVCFFARQSVFCPTFPSLN